MRIGITHFQKKHVEKLVKEYAEIGRKPSFTATNGRIYAADRLGMTGKEYSETATALTDLGKKLVKYMATIKYAQEKLGDDFVKLAVEEYG